MKYTVQFECSSIGDTPPISIGAIEEIKIDDRQSESHDEDCIDPHVEVILEQCLYDWMLEKFEVTYKVLSVKEDNE